MKALVGAFNQEKALVEAFSVIVQLHRLIDLRHYLGCLYFSHFKTLVKNAKTECRAQGAHLVNITGDPAGKI